MKRKKILEVNNKIEVYRDNDSRAYKSLIQEVEKDSFAIAVPEYKRIPLKLQEGDKAYIWSFTKESCYRFSSEVLGKKSDSNGLELYVLKKPQDVQKFERRNFVRIEVALPVFYEVIKPEDRKKWHIYNPANKTYSIDLSGGGIQLQTREHITENTLLVIKIPLNLNETEMNIKLLGRVVRSVYREINGDKIYFLGIKFEEITEKERDYIIKYTFEQMRKTMHLRRSDF